MSEEQVRNESEGDYNWLLWDSLSFFQYFICPMRGVTAFFISDGCDEVFLTKKECEDFLKYAREEEHAHAEIIAEVVENWPKNVVAQVAVFR